MPWRGQGVVQAAQYDSGGRARKHSTPEPEIRASESHRHIVVSQGAEAAGFTGLRHEATKSDVGPDRLQVLT
jgi:hypothetical protein